MGRAVLDTTPGAKAIAQAQKPAGGNRWLRLVLTSPEKKMNPGHRHETTRLSTSHVGVRSGKPAPEGARFLTPRRQYEAVQQDAGVRPKPPFPHQPQMDR